MTKEIDLTQKQILSLIKEAVVALFDRDWARCRGILDELELLEHHVRVNERNKSLFEDKYDSY